MFSRVAFSVLPFSVLPDEDDLSIPSSLSLILADRDADLLFLLVGEPLALGSTVHGGLPLSGMSVPGMSLEDEEYSVEGSIVLIADKEFHTEPEDDPANKTASPRLIQPFNFRIDVPLFNSGESRGRSAIGNVDIMNDDGGIDSLMDVVWVGRTVRIKCGVTTNVGKWNERTLTYSEMETIFKGTVETVSWDESKITLGIRDSSSRLNKPIQSLVYSGSGDFEGDADLAGKNKPMSFGRVFNASPALVNKVNNVFQAHYRSMQSVDEIRDQGLPLVSDGDITDSSLGLSSVLDWTPVAAHYITDLNLGLIRLGNAAAGKVTFDGHGDNEGSYIDTLIEIFRRVAVTFGAVSDPDEIDVNAFTLALLRESSEAGLFVGTEPRDISDVLDELMFSADGWWSFTREGTLTVGIFRDPDGEVATRTVTDTVIENFSLAKEEAGQPAWRYALGYKRNWSPQTRDELADTVTASNRELYSEEYRYVSFSKSSLRSIYTEAKDVKVGSLLYDQTEAQTQVNQRGARDSGKRRKYKLRLSRDLFQYRVGQVISLVYDRFGLENGKNFFVTAVVENAVTRITELEILG